jgi:hypothetical protein
MVVDMPRIGAMPMNATPSVPAVVHELPVTIADDAQMRPRRVEDRRLQHGDAVGHHGRDRAGHVPRADQRADASRMKIAPIAEETPPIRRLSQARRGVAVLQRDETGERRRWRTAPPAAARGASTPNSTMVSAQQPTITTTGRDSVGKLGSLGPRSLADVGVHYVTAAAPSSGLDSPHRLLGDRSPTPGRSPPRQHARRCRGRGRLRSPSERADVRAHVTPQTVALQRAGHAVAAAAALAELEAGDLDHLDTGLAHLGDRVGVALVGHDDARLEGDDVVAVVPLLALCWYCVAAGLDDVQRFDPECIGDGAEEVASSGDVEVALLGPAGG